MVFEQYSIHFLALMLITIIPILFPELLAIQIAGKVHVLFV